MKKSPPFYNVFTIILAIIAFLLYLKANGVI